MDAEPCFNISFLSTDADVNYMSGDAASDAISTDMRNLMRYLQICGYADMQICRYAESALQISTDMRNIGTLAAAVLVTSVYQHMVWELV